MEAQHDLYIALSLAYMKKGEETKLIKLLAKAIGLVENNAMAYVKRGNLYREQNNHMMAENDYTGAIEIDDKNLEALTARANLYKMLGRDEEADEDVERLTEISHTRQNTRPILAPTVGDMSPEELDLDIQSKVREFTNLRNEIFKKGY